MSVTEALVDYAMETRFEDLPSDVIDRAKLCILDSIGCALGGFKTRIGSSIIAALGESNSKESTIIGHGGKVACKDAAFINSTLTNALDYDDDNWVGHPSATTMPATLATAELVGASGKEFLTSFVVGYEVATRIGRAIWPSRERYKKVWGVGTHQAFGAVSAACKLLGLSRFETLNAFGIAGAASPLPSAMKWGFKKRPLTWVKDSVAWATLAGVTGALLARKGFVGCRDILDGETGFWMMAGSDRCDFEKIVKGLGQDYEILRGAFKPYSSCRFTHATLDAVRRILDEHDVKPHQIEEVLVRSIADLTELLVDYEPSEIVDAEFSLPYTVAMIILREPPGPNWFREDLLRNQTVLGLASKVRVETDQQAEELYHSPVPKLVSTVTVTTRNGEQLEAFIQFARGEPENPLSRGELVEKFRRLGSFVLGNEEVDRLLRTTEDLEELRHIGELIRLLQRGQ